MPLRPPPLHPSATRARPRGPALALAVLGCCCCAATPSQAQRAALTQSVDEPGRAPFARFASNATLNPYYATFTVPSTQRWVVEKYTASCDVFTTTALADITAQATTGGNTMVVSTSAHLVQFNGSINGSQVNYHRGTGDGPLYADPGTTIQLSASTAAGTGYSYMRNCSFSISGHAISNL